MLDSDPDSDFFLAFDEVLRIHEVAGSLHKIIGDISKLVETRRRGVGGSHLAFISQSRSERDPNSNTDRRKGNGEFQNLWKMFSHFSTGFKILAVVSGVRDGSSVLKLFLPCSEFLEISCIGGGDLRGVSSAVTKR